MWLPRWPVGVQARRAALAAAAAGRAGEGASAEGGQEEEEEVPQEFLDPILMTIMQVRPLT